MISKIFNSKWFNGSLNVFLDLGSAKASRPFKGQNMQLIWVSGPTARVVTLSITRRKVAVASLVAATVLLLLGGLFQLIGFRLAVDVSPTLALKMGGVASLQEQQRMESRYQQQLERLQTQLAGAVDKLQEIESARQAFLSRVGLEVLAQTATTAGGKPAGRGGPFKWPRLWNAENAALPERLQATQQHIADVQQLLEQTQRTWSDQQSRLELLPLALPLQTEFLLSSHFGLRLDPMTHLPSWHEGLDFVAPVGTPVVATAAGRVVQARFNGAYGLMVEVQHAEGFSTRYAHLQSILVQPGQQVKTGDRLGLLGNTGRSTGPHLHYEVLYGGRAMHPIQAIQAWSRS